MSIYQSVSVCGRKVVVTSGVRVCGVVGVTHVVQLGGNLLDGCRRDRVRSMKICFSFLHVQLEAVCVCVRHGGKKHERCICEETAEFYSDETRWLAVLEGMFHALDKNQ